DSPEARRSDPLRDAPQSAAHSLQDEARLLEYLDAKLDPDHRKAVQEHLATCAHCHALSQQWRQLDSALTVALHHVSLSPAFASPRRRQIEADPPLLPAAERARKRLQLEADLQKLWREYQKGFLRAQVPAFLEYLGYGTGCA